MSKSAFSDFMRNNSDDNSSGKDAAPVDAAQPVVTATGPVVAKRSFGDMVTQRYAERRAASKKRAADQAPTPKP